MSDGDPRRVAVCVWAAIDNLNDCQTDIHELDGEFPDVTADQIQERLETARDSVDGALDALERVREVQTGDGDD